MKMKIQVTIEDEEGQTNEKVIKVDNAREYPITNMNQIVQDMIDSLIMSKQDL